MSHNDFGYHPITAYVGIYIDINRLPEDTSFTFALYNRTLYVKSNKGNYQPVPRPPCEYYFLALETYSGNKGCSNIFVVYAEGNGYVVSPICTHGSHIPLKGYLGYAGTTIPFDIIPPDIGYPVYYYYQNKLSGGFYVSEDGKSFIPATPDAKGALILVPTINLSQPAAWVYMFPKSDLHGGTNPTVPFYKNPA